MWIANTFLNTNWRNNKNGILSTFLPFFNSAPPGAVRLHGQGHHHGHGHDRGNKSALSSTTANHHHKKPLDPEVIEQKKREAELTNASTIGTALMVTNSYRAIVMLWICVGLYPILIGLNSTLFNPVAFSMTKQMQGTNMLANNTSDETCEFLQDSTWSWITSVTPPNYPQPSHEPSLLKLELEPIRCRFQYGLLSIGDFCHDALSGTVIGYGNNTTLALTNVSNDRTETLKDICEYWKNLTGDEASSIARSGGLRAGSVLTYMNTTEALLYYELRDDVRPENFTVKAMFDVSSTVRIA